jgi:riboflavin kinase
MGALKRTIKISTPFLASKLDYSQQTLSRHLIKLEEKGWIKRNIAREGTYLRISSVGEKELRSVFHGLGEIFEKKHPLSVIIEGVVFSGLGEGSYYVTNKGYRTQFINKLGFDPYPGTLNLRIENEFDSKTLEELKIFPGITIKGFKNRARTYGSVKCFLTLICNRIRGAVVLAFRTHYDSSVIEVISPTYLRDTLDLKDEDKLKLEIFLTKK